MGKLLRTFGSFDFNNPRSFLCVCFLVPFIGGLISVWLGADTNWDLTNYHLYNPFALFHKKLAIDLAPAGMQTYFNPLLDIPYYWMSNCLPAVLVGFVMGFIHSGNFVLIALIARQILTQLPASDQFKVPLLLAFFGCLTANFTSAFGNTMGDIITALFVLSSLLIILKNVNFESNVQKYKITDFLLAGFLAGLAMGLKLTNAVFAVSLCASLMILPITLCMRFKIIILFGVAVLLGFAITAGYWLYEMWGQFGNPLFPQFSAFFPNELTRSITVADKRWGPHNLLETFLWPIILSINPLRVGELRHHQIIWAIFYLIVIMWVVKFLFRKINKSSLLCLSSSAQYIFTFIFISFILWMKLFSIQRYLVAVEILLPLMIFVILSHIFSYDYARKYARRLLITSSLIIYVAGAKSWGHAEWSWNMFRIELPPIAAPEKATVIMAGGDPPFGWLAAQFPSEVSFIQIDGSFPANISGYSQRIDQMVKSRNGEVFVIFQAEPDSERFNRVAKANSFFSFLKVTYSAEGCSYLEKIIPVLRLEKKVQLDMDSDNNCHLTAIHLDKEGDEIDAFYESRAVQSLADYGYKINLSSCQIYRAYIGQKAYKYRWCELSKYL